MGEQEAIWCGMTAVRSSLNGHVHAAVVPAEMATRAARESAAILEATFAWHERRPERCRYVAAWVSVFA